MTSAIEPSWAGGAPKANSPEEARRAWGPHLQAWGQKIRWDFWGQTSNDPGAARLGWIEDARFWSDLWAGLENDIASGKRNKDIRKHRIALFALEAGILGNMAAFEAIPHGDMRTEVMEALRKEDVLLAHRVVEWFDNQGIGKSTLPGNPSMLLNTQQYSWSRVKWEVQPNKSPIVRKSVLSLGMKPVVDFLKMGLVQQNYAPFVQINALGNAIVNAPSQWLLDKPGSPGFVQVLQAELGAFLDPSVDIELIALCSGYGPNHSGVYKGIKSLGRHFTGGKTSIGNKKPASPEIQVVLAMCDITDALSLYESVQVGGTHKLQVPESFSLDGLCEPAP